MNQSGNRAEFSVPLSVRRAHLTSQTPCGHGEGWFPQKGPEVFTSVLMIEKPLSSVDVEFVTTLHGDEGVSFIVLMQPRGDQADALLRAIDDIALGELKDAAKEGEELSAKDARRPVELALEHSVRALRAAGCEAVGQVVEDHPLDKMKAVVEEAEADEVIVLTEPHYVEEFFHRDWASRARHKVGVPVLKLFAHNE